MPNEFKNQLDFGGINVSALPDKIPFIDAADCNGIDFSLNGTIKTTGCSSSLGPVTTDIGYEVGDMFVFKKAFGTKKELIIRSAKKTTDNTMRLQWFNNDLTLANLGRWEDLYDQAISTSARFSAAAVNGDNGEKINRYIITSKSLANPLVWNGATAKVSSYTTNQIATSSVLLNEGFTATGEIMVNGKLYAYTGISTGTFTGVTPDPATTSPTVGDGVTQNADDTLMAAALTASATHISFTAPSTILRTTDSWPDDGFKVGQKIHIIGATNTENNGIFTISAFSTTSFANDTITIVEGGLVTEAAGASITVSAGSPQYCGIAISAQGKLWLADVSGLESKVYYSQTGIATSFAITSGLGSGGSFDLVDTGGGVTALMAMGQNKIIIHKNDVIIIYTRGLDNSSNVIESFDNASTGVGIGAVNQNCITSYGKTTYYLSTGGEIRTIEQSIYSTETFSFGSISTKIQNYIEQIKQVNPYMVYDSALSRLVLSVRSIIPTNSSASASLVNSLIYIYVSVGPNGYEYKSSIHEITSYDTYSDIPLVVTSNQTVVNGVIMYIPYLLNAFLIGRDIQSTTAVLGSNDFLSKNYYLTSEQTFGEPAKDKQFSILNIDGYLYLNTIIRFTVSYGVGGRDGVKHYFIDKNSSVVSKTKTYDNEISIFGRSSLTRNYNQSGIGNSYYFKLPLHIDIKKSDRYQIRIETWNQSVGGTFWAINSISTNPVLKDVDMNELANQNEASLDGVGTMIVNDTNQVGKSFYIS